MHSDTADDGSRLRPGTLVLREVARSLGAGALLPLRVGGQLLEGDRPRAEARQALKTSAPLAPETRELHLPQRPLRIFISCAEASGETHAKNLVSALRAVLEEHGAPPPVLLGLGGAPLADAGVNVLGDPVSQARMGFAGVLGSLPFYLGLVHDAAAAHAHGSIDLFIGVDSPALNVPLAHMAKSCGVPTVQYITPQYWGWAPWRVRGFRDAVDCALSILPFEAAWFARHGVDVEHVGHPLLDDLLANAETASTERPPTADGPPVVAVLPGSRSSVIERNLPLQLEALAAVLDDEPTWGVRVSLSDERHRVLIEDCIASSRLSSARVELADSLDETLRGACAAFSVSGTILVHLLQRRLPTVVLYRLEGPLQAWIGRHFLTVPYFSSVNLLAGREVYPEFSFTGDLPPRELHQALRRLLTDAEWRDDCAAQLEFAADRLGPPGASRRAALAALARLRDPGMETHRP